MVLYMRKMKVSKETPGPSLVEIVLDLMEQAKAARHHLPNVAAHIDWAVEALLSDIGVVSVAQAARELHVSPPTIYAWIRAGVLAAEQTDRRTLIPAHSILAILPGIRNWEAEGRQGRPLRAVLAWQEELQELQREADELGRLAESGGNPDLELESAQWIGGPRDAVTSDEPAVAIGTLPA